MGAGGSCSSSDVLIAKSRLEQIALRICWSKRRRRRFADSPTVIVVVVAAADDDDDVAGGSRGCFVKVLAWWQ